VTLDSIAAALDQLASDVRAKSGSPEHSARLAEIWLMVTEQDPEVTRLVGQYMDSATTQGGTDIR
jgi:hypothetical protein